MHVCFTSASAIRSINELSLDATLLLCGSMLVDLTVKFDVRFNIRLDLQPLFGNGACVPPPKALLGEGRRPGMRLSLV